MNSGTIDYVEATLDKDGYFLNERVSARYYLQSGEVDPNDVSYMDSAKNQAIGTSAGLIPFMEHNDVYRSLMGSNQQRQAVPLINPSSPIVGTGIEGDVALNSGQLIVAESDGLVLSASAQEVVVKYKNETKKYYPLRFVRSNAGSSINQKVITFPRHKCD